MPDPIRVLVVDDHAVVRRGLLSFLHVLDGITAVGESADGAEALEFLEKADHEGRPPDVVLTDLLMPGMDGVVLAARIGSRFPDVRVVIMTAYAEPAQVRRALDSGVAGYVLKDATPGEVETAIRAGIRGELYLDPAVARVLTSAPPGSRDIDVLTDRELQVLDLLSRGLTNKDIASRLVISERTARTHVSNILAKLGLSSRTQAALRGAQRSRARWPGLEERAIRDSR